MKNYIAVHGGNLQSFRFIDIATWSFEYIPTFGPTECTAQFLKRDNKEKFPFENNRFS